MRTACHERRRLHGGLLVGRLSGHQNPAEDTSVAGRLNAFADARDLHEVDDDVAKKDLHGGSVAIAVTLIRKHAKFGALPGVKKVFDELPVRSIVSWNALISAYAQHGRGEEALAAFRVLTDERVFPNAVTFACLAKACGSIGAVDEGEAFHAEVARKGLLKNDVVLGSAFVDMYAKFGILSKAREVFDELPARNVVSWTALIRGYCQSGYNTEAFQCFKQMNCEGLAADGVTLACILKACISAREPKKGEQVHAEIVRKGLLGHDSMLGSALVDMYSKCGILPKAQNVFNDLPVHGVIPWSALIAGYSENGSGKKALDCYDQMIHEGLFPDAVAFACTLKACGSIGASEKGKRIHADIVLNGLLDNGGILGNALVDMYAKCGVLERAQQIFHELPARNVISWTSLMAGYCQHEQFEEALVWYDRMKEENLFPNAVTLACILKACGSLGATKKGEEVHVEIVRKSLLGVNPVIGGALVDMYSKCGVLDRAYELCEELPDCSVVHWSALIAGFCEHGNAERALQCFELLKKGGLAPDEITLACVLKACSRVGAAEKGQFFFETMITNYGIVPTPVHHTCMVDLFCSKGQFDEAVAMIDKMESLEYLPAWCALMGACRKWGNVHLGKLAFQQASVHIDSRGV